MTQTSEKNPVRKLAAIVVAALGLVICLAAIIFALIGEGAASLVPGVIAILLGLVSYAIGSRRLGTVTLILGLAVIFFGVAASQGMIPGLSQTDHDYPEDIPQKQSGD